MSMVFGNHADTTQGTRHIVHWGVVPGKAYGATICGRQTSAGSFATMVNPKTKVASGDPRVLVTCKVCRRILGS